MATEEMIYNGKVIQYRGYVARDGTPVAMPVKKAKSRRVSNDPIRAPFRLKRCSISQLRKLGRSPEDMLKIDHGFGENAPGYNATESDDDVQCLPLSQERSAR